MTRRQRTDGGRAGRRRGEAARAFSLIEVLMAIFILGIGVISIAALFPAGIAQQRQSVDDVVGPIVARNAMATIRSRLRADDFGTMEEFGTVSPRPTVEGDWSWLRPAFIDPDGVYPLGAIEMFNATGRADASEGALFPGLPYSTVKYASAPEIVITQEERYFPQGVLDPDTGVWSRPQYVWDCAFRRFQGRILVAVFVYRVSGEAGGPYTVLRRSSVPPLPIWLDLTDPANAIISPGGAWDNLGPDGVFGGGDDNVIEGLQIGQTYDPTDERQSWQRSGQWILDQNNNIHRVLANDQEFYPQSVDDEAVRVELVRPVSPEPNVPVFYAPAVATDVWYLPFVMSDRNREYTLTPVYLAVQEL